MNKKLIITYLDELMNEARRGEWEYATDHDFKVWKIRVNKFITEIYGETSIELNEFQDFFFEEYDINEFGQRVNWFPNGLDDALAFLEAHKSYIERFGKPRALRDKSWYYRSYKSITTFIKSHTKQIVIGVIVAVLSGFVLRFLINEGNGDRSAQFEPAIRILPIIAGNDINSYIGSVKTPTGSIIDSTIYFQLTITIENSGPIMSKLDSLICTMPTTEEVLTDKKHFGLILAPEDKIYLPIPLLLNRDLENTLSLDLFYSSMNDSLNKIERHSQKSYQAKYNSGNWSIKLITPEDYKSKVPNM